MRAFLLILALAATPACTKDKPPASPEPDAAVAPPPAWPHTGCRLTPQEVSFPAGFGKRRVFIDAGHGSPGNSGNTSSLCIDELDHNLRVANHLAACLEKTGHFQPLLSRRQGNLVKYRKRLQAAKSFKAEVFVSIHSDARGEMGSWSPKDGQNCPSNQQEPGFAILWSDQGEPAMKASRLALARAVARRMSAAGFLAYNGVDYEGLYLQDADVPGVFVDRHQPGQRILFLHGPAMPSVIIETHHAWDVREERLWQEKETLDAFCRAVAGVLVDHLGK